MSDDRCGPREEDGDYARDFFDTYERAADEMTRSKCWRGECRDGCYYPDVCSERPKP